MKIMTSILIGMLFTTQPLHAENEGASLQKTLG